MLVYSEAIKVHLIHLIHITAEVMGENGNFYQHTQLSLKLRVLTCIVILNVLSMSRQETIKSSGAFEKVCKGCRVTNYILVAKIATNLFQCIHKCKRYTRCESINYKHLLNNDEQKAESHEHNCELLGITLKDGGRNESFENWEHHEPINFVSTHYSTKPL